MPNTVKITDFFAKDFNQFAMYNNYRSIASFVDGQKPSSRKVIYTLKKRKTQVPVKVSQLAAATSETTNYLHGEVSLCEVISRMASNYTGSNNVNILYPKGNFGSRFQPSPAAPRYIYTHPKQIFHKLFNENDDRVLVTQEFEGDIIEPKFFVPVLPLILLNGSEGLATGFAQSILPRSFGSIKKAILDYLSTGKLPAYIDPYIKGFTGTIERVEDVDGKVKTSLKGSYTLDTRRGVSYIIINEIPPWVDHKTYKDFLFDQADKGVIELPDRFDISNTKTDRYEFRIKVSKDFAALPPDEIMKRLKLSTTVTENFTCMDERNRIVEFKSMGELLLAYIKIRMFFYEKRKEYLIEDLTFNLVKDLNRYMFIKAVLDGKLVVMKRKKEDIEADMVKLDLKKIDNDYGYLLDMSISTFTEEKIIDLYKKCRNRKVELDALKARDIKSLWREDIIDIEDNSD